MAAAVATTTQRSSNAQSEATADQQDRPTSRNCAFGVILERGLAASVTDVDLRLRHMTMAAFCGAEGRGGAPGSREDKKPSQQQRGGQRVQRKKRQEVAFIERGVEAVKPTHPNHELHPTVALNENEQDTGRQVAVRSREV